MKNNYIKEQREFEEKQKMGFKTQEEFFKQTASKERGEGPYTGIAPPAAQQNNFMQRP